MGISIDHDQIRNAVFDQMSERKDLHKKDIKSIIDDVKNQYLWTSKISSEDLNKIVRHLKDHWQDLKDQARSLKRRDNLIGFRRYQV